MPLPSSLTGYSVVADGQNFGAVARVGGLQYAIVQQVDLSYACFKSTDGKVWAQFGASLPNAPGGFAVGFATIYRPVTNDFLVATVDQIAQHLVLNVFSVTSGTWAAPVTQAYGGAVNTILSSAEIQEVGGDYLILFWASNIRTTPALIAEAFFTLLSDLSTATWLTPNVPYGVAPPSLGVFVQITSYDLSFDGASYVICVGTGTYSWKQAFSLGGALGAFNLLSDGDVDPSFITSFQSPGFPVPV